MYRFELLFLIQKEEKRIKKKKQRLIKTTLYSSQLEHRKKMYGMEYLKRWITFFTTSPFQHKALIISTQMRFMCE